MPLPARAGVGDDRTRSSAYMGQVMSLAVWSLVQSNMIAPS
jgi:hypothetical protein